MAFQRVEDAAKIEVVFASHGRIQVNTFHGQHFGAYDEAALQELADAVDEVYGAGIQAFLTTEQAYGKTRVTGLNSEFDLQVESNTSAGPGTVSQVLFPANVTKAFTLRSPYTGRSARGRIYYPTLNNPQTETDENFVTTTFTTAFIALLELTRIAINNSGWAPVIVSRWSGGVKRTEGATFPWTSTGISSLTTDSMRGRLPKV